MKVTCPICGEPGYLTRVKVNGHYYMRIEHITYKDGKREKRVHYIGRDINELKQRLEELFGNKNTYKMLRFAGGDFRIAAILLPRIEKLCTFKKCTLVEVFGGSGYVSQSVNRSIFGNIIFNDIDNKLTSFYKTVKETPEKLALILSLLPYSRSLHKIAQELLKTSKELSSLVTAVLLFYSINTTIFGKPNSQGFAYTISPLENEARAFRTRIWAILKYANVWKDITIENLDFREIIKRYDSEKTVFYLDPPYPDRAIEYYGHPFTVNDLREMAKMLTMIRGKFLLKLDEKTYTLIQDILPEGKYKVEFIEKILHQKKVRVTQRGKWILVLVSNANSS
jgi:DNA adenine methylase